MKHITTGSLEECSYELLLLITNALLFKLGGQVVFEAVDLATVSNEYQQANIMHNSETHAVVLTLRLRQKG